MADALAHPTWTMGPKITIHSSTLMNKGLEVIEAHELFGIDYDRIGIVVHPQSIVHSMVELRGPGRRLGDLAAADMRMPISYASGRPDRAASPYGALDWSQPRTLTFEAPDRSVFRCVDLAYEAGRRGGSRGGLAQRGQRDRRRGLPRRHAQWDGIAGVVAETMEGWVDDHVDQVEGILVADAEAWVSCARCPGPPSGRGGRAIAFEVS